MTEMEELFRSAMSTNGIILVTASVPDRWRRCLVKMMGGPLHSTL